MSRTRIVTVATIAVFVFLAANAALAGGAAAAPDIDCAGSGGGAMFVADSGFTVEYNDSEPMPSGGPFRGDETLRFHDVNLSSGAAASIRLEDGTGPETCLAAVDASAGTIQITPDGEQAIEIDGQVETFSLADVDYGDGGADFAYVANGDWTLTLNDIGLSQGASVQAIPSSGAAISTGTVGANGALRLAFPTGYFEVDLQQVGGGSGQPSGSPQFSIGPTSANASRVATDEPVGVTVEIRNDGNVSGQYTATLTADEQSVDSATVTVAANDVESVTLSTSFDQNGSYQLAVDGQSAGTITVGESLSVSLANFQLDRTEVEPGEPVTVTGRIENQGSQAMTEEVALAVDGQVVETQSFRLGSNSSETVSFEYTFQSAGEKTVSVDGRAVGTVEVVAAQSAGGGGSGGLPWLALGAVALVFAGAGVVGYIRYGGGSSGETAGAVSGNGAESDVTDADEAVSPAPQAANEEGEGEAFGEQADAVGAGSDGGAGTPADVAAETGGEKADEAATDDGPRSTEEPQSDGE